MALTGEAGQLAAITVREARRLVTLLRERARGRGAQRKLTAANRLQVLIDRAAKVCERNCVRTPVAARAG